MKPEYAVIGCGKVGTVLAKLMSQAGYPCAGVASKSMASARQAALAGGTTRFGTDNHDIAVRADIVLITTPDSLIETVCRDIAAKKGFKKGSTILHCSGSQASTILSTAGDCGAVIGSMHPLQSFASKDISGNPFNDIIVSVEGDPEAVSTARHIAVDLGARCTEIKTDAKTLYHASAVTACNYLTALMDMAFKLIGYAGVSSEDAFDILKPLIEGTLKNIENVGIPQALTGPIERGDSATIRRHLTEIRSQAPELLPLYTQLGIHTIGIARAKGSLSGAGAKKLEKLFETL